MPRKILIIDDEVAICELFSEILRQDGLYETATETDGNAALMRLQQEVFDVVLLDLLMPAINGLDLLGQIKEEFEDLPVIIVTGHGSIEAAVDSMQAGAADFVTKPVEVPLLRLRVQKTLENARLKRLASTDSLTKVYTHRAFHQRLDQEVERANRYHRMLSLLMVDLDHFKQYNKTHGHLRGDSVLVDLTAILREGSRTTDILARYGGKVFALLLPETSAAQSEKIAQRLCERAEHHRFPGEDKAPERILTVSIGVATHVPFFGTKEALLDAAEAALAAAKHDGRNCVRIAE